MDPPLSGSNRKTTDVPFELMRAATLGDHFEISVFIRPVLVPLTVHASVLFEARSAVSGFQQLMDNFTERVARARASSTGR